MPCIYCSSEKFKSTYMEDVLFNDKTFKYLKCLNCEVISIFPIPDENDFEKMYPPTYQGEIPSKISGKYNDLLKRYQNKKLKILDYGCGNAEFLFDVKNNGHQAIGIEYNPQFVQILNNNTEDINFYSIDEFNQSEEKYNVIMLNNVLEHVSNPNELLKTLKNRLKEDGELIIRGPIENNVSFALLTRKIIFGLRKKLLNKKLNHVPYHLTFTNRKNQLDIINRNGFSTIQYEILENAWPYPASLNKLNLKKYPLYFVAKISIILHKVFPKKLGNNFLWIGKLN